MANEVNFNSINISSKASQLAYFDDGSPTIIEESGATITYMGYAMPGVETSEPYWMIKRVIEDNPLTTVTYANYDKQFDKIWDNKLDYFVVAPSTPVLIEVSYQYAKNVKISWERIYNAGFYLLDIALDSGFTNIFSKYSDLKIKDTIGGVPPNNIVTYTIDNIPLNTTLYVRLRAKNFEGLSDYSDTKTIIING